MTATEKLFELTTQIVNEGVSLVPRVVPADAPFIQYKHFPEGDCIASNKSRWFYHAHRPEEREEGEHGHFHMFLPLDFFKGIEPLVSPPAKNKRGKPPAKVVHFAALSFGLHGMPLSWFTVNHWVTFEYMMPAKAIADRLHRFDMKGAPGDPLVNEWLTCAVEVCRDQIVQLLDERDAALADGPYMDKSIEITSRSAFDF